MKLEIFILILLAMLTVLAAMFWNSILAAAVFIGLLLIFLGKNYFALARQTRLVREEKEEREAILSSLSDGVLQYDARGNILLMNSKAEEFFGVTVAELSGIEMSPDIWDLKPAYRALVEVMHTELAPFTLSRGGDSPSSEKGLEVHTSHPELRLLVVTKEMKGTEGQVEGYVKIIRDISHEAFLSKIKSQFVSVAAHQLRTPLAALKWSLKLLLDGDVGKLSAEQVSATEKNYEITERMIKLVNDLLDAARIEEGRFGYEFKEIDIVNFFEKLIKNYEPLAQKQKIRLSLVKSEDLISPLYADPDRISMAFSNLIDNAFHYTKPEGKVEIKLSREGEYAKITISDTGIGIPENERARVFSKFFRASNAIRHETEGTGLGLFIVRNIIKRHGGEVSFTSEEGKGTSFDVVLPFKKDLIPKQEAPVEEFLGSI